MLTVAMQGP